MRWLITGGCGFIGRALIRTLLDETPQGALQETPQETPAATRTGRAGHAIRVYDNLSVGTRADLAGTAAFTEGTGWEAPLTLLVADILDAAALAAAARGADVIVHLAANTGVGPSVEDPRMDCAVNVTGTLNALEAARAAGTGRFVFASSGAPLGVQTPPLHEEMAPHPASPYGASKLAGEGYCSAYFHSFGIDTVTLRFGNVYGEGSTHKASVVAKFIKRALAGEVLEIYGDGSQTRDFIHISDLVRAIRAAATAPGIGGECFQIATAAETTVGELTETLVAAMVDAGMARPRVVNGATRTGDVARNYSDTSKARRLLGWQAEVALPDGLARTVRFFLDTSPTAPGAPAPAAPGAGRA